MYRLARVLRRFSSPVPGLVASLDREIAYERQRLLTFLKRSGFALHETEDSARVALRKRVEDSDVEVTFRAAEHVPEDAHKEDEENEEARQVEANKLRFDVAVALGPQRLLFSCEASEKKWEITHIAFEKTSAATASDSVYEGPELREGAVMDSATDYLEHYGIDMALVSFIENLAKDKEKRLYLRWLQETRDFFARGLTLL